MIDLLAERIARRPEPAAVAGAGKAISGANPWAYGMTLPAYDGSALRRDPRAHRLFIREAIGIYHSDRHIKRAEQVIVARVTGVDWHLEDAQENELEEDGPAAALAVRDLLRKPTGGKRDGNQPASWRELVGLTVRHAGLVNVAFWYLDEIDRLVGWPKRLLYIRPDRMTPALDGNGELAAWSLDQGADGKGTKLELDEVLTFYVEPPDDGFYGHGLVEAALALARKTRLADSHENDVLDAGGRLAGIVSPKGGVGNEVNDPAVFDRLQLDLRNVVDLPDAAKRAIVARAPVDFIPTAADFQKLQTEELGRLAREEKFGLWGVNPTLAGFPAPTGLSSGDSRKFDEAATWQNACQPRADMITETIQYQLLDRLQKVGLALNLILEVPTFDDDTPAFENAAKAEKQPITQRERRAILSLPPFDDERDDEVWIGDQRIYPAAATESTAPVPGGPAPEGPAGEVAAAAPSAGGPGAEPFDVEEGDD